MRLSEEEFIKLVEWAPLVSVDFIVRGRDGRYLLGKRRNSPAKGYWFVPGGRIEKGQTRQNAITSLLRRELRLDYRRLAASGRLRFIQVADHLYEDDNFYHVPGLDTQYVVLAYDVEASPRLALLPRKEHSEYRWFSKDELLQSPNVHRFVKAFVESEPTGPDLGLYRALMAHYLHYEGQMWSRTQILLATQGAVFVAVLRQPLVPITPYLAGAGALLAIALWRLIERDRQNRDVNLHLMDRLVRASIGEPDGKRQVSVRSHTTGPFKGITILRVVFALILLLDLALTYTLFRYPRLLALFFGME